MIVKLGDWACTLIAEREVLARYNNTNRDTIIDILIGRDGMNCSGCLKLFLSRADIRVDHIDGNKKHNCLCNMQMLCNSCNITKEKYQSIIQKQFPEFATNWLKSFLNLHSYPQLQNKFPKEEQPTIGHSPSARPTVCVYVNDSARASLFDYMSRFPSGASTPVESKPMELVQVAKPIVKDEPPAKAVDVQHERDRQASKDTSTRSQIISDWAWPRYRDWSLFLWHLGYELSYDVITATLSAEMDVKHGTIKNHYFKSLTAPFSGLFQLNASDKLAGYERNPLVEEQENEPLIKAIIEEWLKHNKTPAEFRQKYDRYHIKRLARAFQMDDERLLELVIVRLLQAPLFKTPAPQEDTS